MALGSLLIPSTAVMPRPHCLRERCVSELLLLLSQMCLSTHTRRCYSSHLVLSFYLELVFDNYQWKYMWWERERHWNCDEMLAWRLHTDHFQVYFCLWCRGHRCDHTCQRSWIFPPQIPGVHCPLPVSSLGHSSPVFLSINDIILVIAASFRLVSVAPRPWTETLERGISEGYLVWNNHQSRRSLCPWRVWVAWTNSMNENW